MNSRRFRIVFGPRSVEHYKQKSDLRDVYCADGVLVQAAGDFKIFREGEKLRSVFFGRVCGLRNGSGSMSVTHTSHSDFKTYLSDSSVETCMNTLEGRFVLLQREKSGSFEIGCDRYGQMDLYYQKTDDGVVFGSDLSLLPLRDSKCVEYDSVGVTHALHIYGCRPAKRHTLYKGVKRLGVRETALWKSGKLTFRRIPPVILPTREYGEKELKEYSEILMDAVERRSSPNGNVLYFSSGWDSTALLAFLVKLHGPKKVRAVTGRLKFSERSGVNNPFEIERAKQITDYFGVPLEIVDTDWSKEGPQMLERWQPFMRSHMLASMSFCTFALIVEYVAKTMNGNEAVFAGEISDGAHNLGFSQFTTLFHPVSDFREYSDKMAAYLFGPTFLGLMQNGTYKKDIVYNLLKQKFPDAIFDEAASTPEGCIRQLFSAFFLRNTRVPLFSLNNNRFLTEWGKECYQKEMEETYLNDPSVSAAGKPETLYSWLLHLYNNFHWQGGTIAHMGLNADECGFAMNMPFWDSRIQELLSAMPESWGRGLDLRPTKYPLKWMLEHCIDNYPFHLQKGPHSYLYDVNPDFSHEGEFIYASQFTPLMKKWMSEKNYQRFLSPEVFDHGYWDKIAGHYLEGKEVVSERTDLASLSLLALTDVYSGGL